MQARLARWRDLLDQGHDLPTAMQIIAREFGISIKSLRFDRAKLGLQMTPEQRRALPHPRRKFGLQRRAQVVDLARQGLSGAEIRARLGMSVSALAAHIRALRENGLPEGAEAWPLFGQQARIDARIHERRSKVIEARKRGLSILAIAANLGIAKSLVWSDLVAAGMAGSAANDQQRSAA